MDTQAAFPFVSGQLTRLLTDIGVAAKIVNHQVNRAGLAGILGDAGTTNVQDEAQQKLDVFADDTFMRILSAGKSVAGIGSEEQDAPVLCGDEGKSGKYIVLMDPLDGSSNVDVNVSIGTIFSIHRRVTPMGEAIVDADFLQAGTAQVAAGYVLYGSSTMLVFTTGSGVNGFTLDPAVGEFFLSHSAMKFPEKGRIYSVNDALLGKCCKPAKLFVEGCQITRGARFRARYIGSLVADFHRNLIHGGIYLYPSLIKKPNGKLRLLYECAPLAFVAEQAGGMAIDDEERIMERVPSELHQRVPFYVGNRNLVHAMMACQIAEKNPEMNSSPPTKEEQ